MKCASGRALRPRLVSPGLLLVLLALPGLALAQAPGATTRLSDKPGVLPLSVTYADGLALSSADGKHELRLAASGHFDSRFYPGTEANPGSFDIRRARLELGAKLFKYLDVRIQAALEDSPYLRNAFVDLAIHKALHLRAGQMKVPFSSAWQTPDNQLDFLELPTETPLYPFIDRGAMLWGSLLGERVVYSVGVFNGVGTDSDSPKGDVDHKKEVAYRLFLQPFRGLKQRWLSGLYLVGQGTWGGMSIPTRRFETRGLVAPDYASNVFRWRTEQVLGSNVRDVDQISAALNQQTRWGAELHYLLGRFTFSSEWTMVHYDNVAIYHDLLQGSTRLRHDLVQGVDGAIHNLSAFVSVFITGEKKTLDTFGWRQPSPLRPLSWRKLGPGSLEVLARFSRTWIPERYRSGLFGATKVSGFTAADATGIKGPLPAEGASVNAAVLDGASEMLEGTFGINWALNYHLRIMLDYTYLVAPSYAVDAKGNVSGGLVAGAASESGDVTTKNQQVQRIHEIGLRFIFRI